MVWSRDESPTQYRSIDRTARPDHQSDSSCQGIHSAWNRSISEKHRLCPFRGKIAWAPIVDRSPGRKARRGYARWCCSQLECRMSSFTHSMSKNHKTCAGTVVGLASPGGCLQRPSKIHGNWAAVTGQILKQRHVSASHRSSSYRSVHCLLVSATLTCICLVKATCGQRSGMLGSWHHASDRWP